MTIVVPNKKGTILSVEKNFCHDTQPQRGGLNLFIRVRPVRKHPAKKTTKNDGGELKTGRTIMRTHETKNINRKQKNELK